MLRIHLRSVGLRVRGLGFRGFGVGNRTFESFWRANLALKAVAHVGSEPNSGDLQIIVRLK